MVKVIVLSVLSIVQEGIERNLRLMVQDIRTSFEPHLI
jgi:hypothetical protein